MDESETPKPNTVYGFHKLISKQIIRSYQERYGLNAVIFRLFNVYGVDPAYGKEVISIFIRNILEKKPLVVSGPNKFRDFVYVEDVARAFLGVYVNGLYNKTVNIGSGIKITLRQLSEIVRNALPNVEVIEKQTSNDGTGICADISLARKLFHFNPMSPNEGIERHIRKYAGGLG